MRLFVAIELDDVARGAIAAEQARIAATYGDVVRGGPRFVRAEHMHLTLAFLGEVADAQARVVTENLRAPIPLPRFSLGFGGVGAFPPRGAPRVLWLGVVEGESRVIEVQAHVAARLQKLGFEAERRPYRPHLTLARWKESRSADRPRDDGRTIGVVARVAVGTITLFQSRLSSKGPTYTALAQAPLTGRAALD